MRTLSASEIIRIWEIGQGQSALDRALTVLAVAGPDKAQGESAMLGIGERDGRLFAVRERTFGPELTGLLDCPACANRLEITMQTGNLCGPPPVDSSEPFTLGIDGYELRFRLPNSFDLAAVTGATDAQGISRDLLGRCVESARCDESAIAFDQLPAGVIDAVIERMSQADPRMEIEIGLRCPACGNAWQVLFDIASFLWGELCARAQRLLREVHTLASAYGWREAEILALSPQRRQSYLEMIGG
jgi:hypothetical protein